MVIDRKGQGAKEYLLTYGWVVLAVLVVFLVGVLLWQLFLTLPTQRSTHNECLEACSVLCPETDYAIVYSKTSTTTTTLPNPWLVSCENHPESDKCRCVEWVNYPVEKFYQVYIQRYDNLSEYAYWYDRGFEGTLKHVWVYFDLDGQPKRVDKHDCILFNYLMNEGVEIAFVEAEFEDVVIRETKRRCIRSVPVQQKTTTTTTTLYKITSTTITATSSNHRLDCADFCKRYLEIKTVCYPWKDNLTPFNKCVANCIDFAVATKHCPDFCRTSSKSAKNCSFNIQAPMIGDGSPYDLCMQDCLENGIKPASFILKLNAPDLDQIMPQHGCWINDDVVGRTLYCCNLTECKIAILPMLSSSCFRADEVVCCEGQYPTLINMCS